MNLQDEEGNYFETKNINFNEEGYHFNKGKSSCEGGSELNWKDGKLQITTDKADKCHVYLDNNSFVEDLSGNGHHGKNIGALWQENGLLLGDDENFYGYINCGLKNYEFKNSVSFVIKFVPNKTSSMHLVSSHEATGLALIIDENYLRFSLYILELSAYKEVYINKPPQIGEVMTLIGTYDGQEIQLYLNGNKIANLAVEGNIKPSPTFIAIGGNPTADIIDGRQAYILLHEALIFNRALTEEEIQKDYTDEINPTNKQDLLLWYKFD